MGAPGTTPVWRTDQPEFGQSPIWQYVFIQGDKYHSGHTWARAGWGLAAIRARRASDHFLGYRRSDIETICAAHDIDVNSAAVVGWLPAIPPAPITESQLESLPPREDGKWGTQGLAQARGEKVA